MADNAPEKKKEENGAGPDAKHRLSVVLDGVDKAAANIAGTVLGFPVDAMNWGLSFVGLGSEKPVGGSKWISEKVENLTDAQNKALNFTPPEHVDQTDKNLFTGAKLLTELGVGATAFKLMLPPAAAGAQTLNVGAQTAKIASTAPEAVAAAATSSFAGSVANASWWATKAAAKTVVFPVTHWKTTIAGVGALHMATGGESTHGIINAGASTLNFIEEQAPGLTTQVGQFVLDSGAYIGQGITGALGTAAERGGEAIVEKLEQIPGVPTGVRVIGEVVKNKAEALKETLTGDTDETHNSHGLVDPVIHSVQGGTGNFTDAAGEELDDLTKLATNLSGGKDMMDIVSGKGEAAKRFAKDNPGAMAIGAFAGLNTSGGLLKKTASAAIWTAISAVLLKFLEPVLKPLRGYIAPLLESTFGKYMKDDKPSNPGVKNPLQFTAKDEPQPASGAVISKVAPQDPTISKPLANDFGSQAKDPLASRVQARVDEHIEQLRKDDPKSVYLSSAKNEEKYRALMTDTFTAQLREEESNAQKLALQTKGGSPIHFQRQQQSQPLMLSLS